MVEHWYETDLRKMPFVRKMSGRLFKNDDDANKIGVKVFDGGEEITLTGTISASVIRQDGETITVSGSKSGNTAWVILPDDAYEVVGKLEIFLKVTNGSEVATLLGVETYVYPN